MEFQGDFSDFQASPAQLLRNTFAFRVAVNRNHRTFTD